MRQTQRLAGPSYNALFLTIHNKSTIDQKVMKLWPLPCPPVYDTSITYFNRYKAFVNVTKSHRVAFFSHRSRFCWIAKRVFADFVLFAFGFALDQTLDSPKISFYQFKGAFTQTRDRLGHFSNKKFFSNTHRRLEAFDDFGINNN